MSMNPFDPEMEEVETESVTVDVTPPFPANENGVSVIPMDDGGVEVDFDPEADLPEIGFYENLAEILDEKELMSISKEVMGKYQSDLNSRKDWEETYKEGLKLLGFEREERTIPWQGSCGITHPLLAEAVVRFQSQSIGEIFPAAGPVAAKIVGKKTEEKVKQGHRVKDFMNYLLTDVIKDYRDETDKMLFTLASAGSAFKKVYWDSSVMRPAAVFIPPEDVVVPYGSTSIVTAQRITHVMREDINEVRKSQRDGWYVVGSLSASPEDTSIIQEQKNEVTGIEPTLPEDDRIVLLEMQINLNIPGFEDKLEGEDVGIALPYVVTVVKDTGKVLGIRRNWLESDEKKVRRNHFSHYQYIPGFGFYGFGLIHLVGGITEGATSMLRQLVDSGTLANLPSGFKAKGFRVKGDETPIAPGEFRDVDVPGTKIQDNIMPLPFKEPSQVLAGLLSAVVEEGRRFASLTDINISSMNQEAPVGTTLALLERNLKVMTAIMARIHNSMRHELVMLADIARDNYTDYPYEVEEGDFPNDFSDEIDVIPVSDPNAATMAQRLMKYQAAHQISQQRPQNFNTAILDRRMLVEMEIPDAEEIVPVEDDIKQCDPISENQKILRLDPVKAFPTQNHQAHIQVHMMGMQDPKIRQLLQDSPTAQASYAAGMAHITEHLGYEYRSQIEERLGVPLPPEGEPLPPDVEGELSALVASAAQRLFGDNQIDVANEEAKKKLEDPVYQMQMKELEIKDRDSVAKLMNQQERLQLDMAKMVQKYELDIERLDQQRELGTQEIAAMVLGEIIKAASGTESLESNERMKLAEIINEKLRSNTGDGNSEE